MRGALALMLLAACSNADMLQIDEPNRVDPDDSIDGTGLVLIVYPGETTSPDGSVRALPVQVVDPDFEVDQEVTLLEPFRLDGVVTGRRTQSIERIALPGVDGPAVGSVVFEHPEALDRWRVNTDADGQFGVDLVAGLHDVTFAPEDPGLALTRWTGLELGPESSFEVEVDAGAPVWGRVLEDGEPREGATVEIVSGDGVVGPPATTDADGWYELRAMEGLEVTVRSRGAGNGIDPVVSAEPVVPTANGARVDLAYAVPTTRTLAARVLLPDGTPARQLPYRLRSVGLSNFDLAARVEQTGFSDNSGNIVTQAVEGDYVLDLLVQEEGIAGRSLPTTVTLDTALGTVQLEGVITLSGEVVDSEGEVSPETRITCAERGLGQRAWAVDSRADGTFTLEVPRTDLSCTALPGAERRSNMAARRFAIARDAMPLTGALGGVDVELPAGRTLQGVVSFRGEAESLALVEVRTADGMLLATDLTGADGAFQVRVHAD